MKKYKNTDELTASKYFVTCTFREELLIGQLAFQIYIYLLDLVDEDRFLFGCFHHDETVSPVFDSYNDCLKYAIYIHNQELYDKTAQLIEEDKKLLQGFAYKKPPAKIVSKYLNHKTKKCVKHVFPEPEQECCGGLNGKDHLGDPVKNRKRSKQL
jgi:hypothetical protein